MTLFASRELQKRVIIHYLIKFLNSLSSNLLMKLIRKYWICYIVQNYSSVTRIIFNHQIYFYDKAQTCCIHRMLLKDLFLNSSSQFHYFLEVQAANCYCLLLESLSSLLWLHYYLYMMICFIDVPLTLVFFLMLNWNGSLYDCQFFLEGVWQFLTIDFLTFYELQLLNNLHFLSICSSLYLDSNGCAI